MKQSFTNLYEKKIGQKKPQLLERIQKSTRGNQLKFQKKYSFKQFCICPPFK